MAKQKLIICRKISGVCYVVTGDRVYHVRSEYSKLAQKEDKCKHNWVGELIHWEVCKIIKFIPTDK